MALTAIQEDYLETIYRLSRDKAAVRTTDVAERLGCRLPTVTRTVRKIVQAGFVAHESRGLIGLTDLGNRAAENIAHRHADTLRFLSRILGLSTDQADACACQIEHGLSPLAAQRLHEFLEYIDALDDRRRAVITEFARQASATADDFPYLPIGKAAGWRG